MFIKKSIFRVSRKDRDGFSVLEIALMLTVVGLAGAVGFMAYDAHTKSVDTARANKLAIQKQTVQPGTAEDVSDRFVDAMMKNNADTAYQLTSPDYRSLTNQAQTQKTFEGITTRISKKPIKLAGQTPNQKIYHYTAQGAEGPQTLIIRMQSVSNNWLVYGFQLYEPQL